MSALIAAVTEPAHPRELAGERAAVAAFRQARRLSPSPSRRRSTVPGLAARSLAAKVVISIGVLSFGGIAVAAETGSLPDAAQSAAHRLLGAVGVPDADEHAINQAGSGDGSQLDANHPAVPGLCRAFAAGEKDEHGTALDSTAFRALATAAGGEDKIEAFCAEVLADPSPGPSAVPSQGPTSPVPTPTDPSGSTNAPSEPPTEPSSPSTQPPPTHPTGPPTELPTSPPTTPTQRQY